MKSAKYATYGFIVGLAFGASCTMLQDKVRVLRIKARNSIDAAYIQLQHAMDSLTTMDADDLKEDFNDRIEELKATYEHLKRHEVQASIRNAVHQFSDDVSHLVEEIKAAMSSTAYDDSSAYNEQEAM